MRNNELENGVICPSVTNKLKEFIHVGKKIASMLHFLIHDFLS